MASVSKLMEDVRYWQQRDKELTEKALRYSRDLESVHREQEEVRRDLQQRQRELIEAQREEANKLKKAA